MATLNSRIALVLPAAVVFFCIAFTSLSPSMHAQTIAFVQPGNIPAATYVNVYWDQTWDADNPAMTMNRIDNFTSALLNSTYFSGLAEYGVTSASFNSRSYVADPECGYNGTAGASIGFVNFLYAPPTPLTPALGEPGVLQFITCEITNSHVPTGPNYVYNILLPPRTSESDGSDFIGLPNGIVSVKNSCTNYSGYHFGLSPVGPLFTVIFTNPAAGCLGSPGNFAAFTENLSHEMVEAASDPLPALSAVFGGGGGEIGDLCTPGAAGSMPGAGTSLFLTNFGGGTTEKYWSNAAQACIGGFSITTTPTIATVFPVGTGPNISLTVAGLGFGALPPITSFAGNIGTPVNLAQGPALIPYLAVQDFGESDSRLVWEAGNLLVPDSTLVSATWSGASIGVALSLAPGVVAMPGDSLAVIVCNPASGGCGTSPRFRLSAVISALSPNIGPATGGTLVTISGSGFTGNTTNTTVLFGDRPPVTPTSVSTAQVQVVSPMSRPGIANVRVSTRGLPSSGASYTYCHPQVSQVMPKSSPKGIVTDVTIAGSCFTGASAVTFGAAGTAFVGTPEVSNVTETQVAAKAPVVPKDSPICKANVQVISPDLDGFVGGSASAGSIFLYGDQVGCEKPNEHVPPMNPCYWNPAGCLSILGLSQLVTAGQPLQPADFNDLGGFEGAAAAIREVVLQGVLQGVSAHRFAPAQPVTRSEFANGLVRTLNFPARHNVVFSDIEIDHPMHAIYAAVQPYMTEYPDSTGSDSFKGGLPLDRQEASLTAISLLVASRKLKLIGGEQSEQILKQFDDQKMILSLFRPYVATAIKNGILSVDLKDKKSFHPNSFLTRADLADLLVHLEGFFGHK